MCTHSTSGKIHLLLEARARDNDKPTRSDERTQKIETLRARDWKNHCNQDGGHCLLALEPKHATHWPSPSYKFGCRMPLIFCLPSFVLFYCVASESDCRCRVFDACFNSLVVFVLRNSLIFLKPLYILLSNFSCLFHLKHSSWFFMVTKNAIFREHNNYKYLNIIYVSRWLATSGLGTLRVITWYFIQQSNHVCLRAIKYSQCMQARPK